MGRWHGVQVARRLGQTGVVADAVRGQLGGGVLASMPRDLMRFITPWMAD